MRGQLERAEELRRLHTADAILVLVNAWDVASARVVAGRPGCTAIATASAAIAASHGYDDGEQIPLAEMIATVRRICAAVDVPVTADLEEGYGDPAATVVAALEAGAVGANLEDAMRPLDEALDMVTAALGAAARVGVPLVLNARTDTHLVETGLRGEARLAEAIRRGSAFLAAGADCVFVPGCTDESEIGALVDAFGGRLSLLGVPGLPPPPRLQELGVARVSFGPYPQQAALDALAAYGDALFTQP